VGFKGLRLIELQKIATLLQQAVQLIVKHIQQILMFIVVQTIATQLLQSPVQTVKF
jgi:hypothetical protein